MVLVTYSLFGGSGGTDVDDAVTYRLEDGGTLSTTDDVQSVGEHGIPSKMTYRHEGGENLPALEMTIEVRGGAPVCTQVRLTATQAGHVRVKDVILLATLLESRVEDLAAIAAWEPTTRGSWSQRLPDSDYQSKVRTVRSARQAARRKLTPERLAKVAEVYRETEGNKLDAIGTEFGVSERTAARYVAEARKEGLLCG
jgi:hypothetical protein